VGDLLIRGGTLIDGGGGPSRDADVRVRAGRIVDVGPGLRAEGETELDASGAVVTPGFIDTHTHYDPALFWDPAADPMPQHGVTTMLLGNCSLSLAPLKAEHRAALSDCFAFIEDLPIEAFETGVPWGWETWAGYRDAMQSRGYGVNSAGLVGHTPLRLFVMGDAAWERPATESERTAMAAVLDECLRDGAFGLSTSLFHRDRNGRLVPSGIADDHEVGTLLDVLASRGAFLEFIPDIIAPNMPETVERYASLLATRDVTATWNAIIHMSHDKGARARALLEQAAQMQAKGIHIYPQVSPRTIDVQISWVSTVMFSHLPGSWNQIVATSDGPSRAAMLQDHVWRDRARQEWDAVTSEMFPHRHPELARLVSVTRAEDEEWVGKRFSDLVAERGGHPSDVLADWVLRNDLQPGIAAVVGNADPDGMAEMLVDASTIISASDAGAHINMFCAAGDTTLLLTRHVRDRQDLSLERAIWELTGRQAEIFGFEGRGKVSVGMRGDLAVFALDELSWDADVRVRDVPGEGTRLRRPPGGYRYTIIDGTVTQAHGQLTGALPGAFLNAQSTGTR